MSESPRIIGIRVNGSPDLAFIDATGFSVPVGEAVTVQTPEGTQLGRVVIGSGQMVASPDLFDERVSGILERDDEDFTVALKNLPSEPAPQLGSSVDEPDRAGTGSSIHDLYREYESGDPRLGSHVDTQGRAGVVVGVDRERGVAKVKLDSGEFSEIELHAKG